MIFVIEDWDSNMRKGDMNARMRLSKYPVDVNRKYPCELVMCFLNKQTPLLTVSTEKA